MKVLCVLNPSAAGGEAMRLWPEVSELLRKQDVEFDLLSLQRGTLMKDQVVGVLKDSGSGAYDVVAGIGGDGTHAGVINGLMQFHSACPAECVPRYAFIPLGTGNDIAKSLGIRFRDDTSARDLRRAVSTIVHGADYRLDLGLINGTYFADALTVGLDSRILKERNSSKRLIEKIPLLKYLARGRFLYTISLGARFFRQSPVDVDIIVDGRSWYKGLMINLVINNTRIYAGDFDFSMEAYPDDGLLDIVLFTDHADYLTRYLLAIRHNPDKIRDLSDELHRRSMHTQGREIEVRLAHCEHAQIDGEEFPENCLFKVTVVPRVLAIKTPAEPM
ncbi:MAG: diacylglycerol kinase family protein [bacterium]